MCIFAHDGTSTASAARLLTATVRIHASDSSLSFRFVRTLCIIAVPSSFRNPPSSLPVRMRPCALRSTQQPTYALSCALHNDDHTLLEDESACVCRWIPLLSVFNLRVAYGFFFYKHTLYMGEEKYPQIQQRMSLEPLNRFRSCLHH